MESIYGRYIGKRKVNVRYERDNSINYAVIDAQKEWNCEDDYEVKYAHV